jgi:arylsulfatase A-like enzyme
MRPVPLVLCLLGALSAAVASAVDRPPNILIIFADDLGYGDLGCQGHPTINTPHLDRLAASGKRFTDFYVASGVCSPSRAALLTGRYPIRSGMYGVRGVLFPDSKGGLPDEEVTLAELLRDQGYATAHIGKWHLGVHPGSRPHDQGFDFSFGIPYSNDMDWREGTPRDAAMSADPPLDGWDVPLIRNGEIIERPVDQRSLTQRYTAAAVGFIHEHPDQPFLLYFAHTFPHVPLFASPHFQGRSARGIYGDVVEELDWSIGQVIAALRDAGVADRTLVVFTSDNGPWLTQGLQGGSAGLLRDGKASTWEGGMRVPAIAWWPGRILPGVVHDPANTMDLFVTAALLGGAAVPEDRPIDGADIASLLFDEQPLPERPFFYYRGRELAGCRLGNFKLHLSTQNGYSPEPPARHDPPLLFDLGRDPGEHVDVAADHPDIVARIQALIQAHEITMRAGPPQFD